MPVLSQIDETTSIPLKFIFSVIAVSSAAVIGFGRWLFNISGTIKAHEQQIAALNKTLADVTATIAKTEANIQLTNTEFRDSASDARERMARVETMVEVIYKQITQK